MKYFILFFALIFIIFGCNKTAKKQGVDEKATSAIIQVDELLKNPDSYDGKAVAVEGMVIHVCKHSGKRLHLKAGTTEDWIRVEAKGQIGQFDKSLEGDNIIVNGVFHKQMIDSEYLSKMEKEMSSGNAMGHDRKEGTEMNASESLLEELKSQLSNSGQKEMLQLWIDGEKFSVKQPEEGSVE
jgi:hypothetical protein